MTSEDTSAPRSPRASSGALSRALVAHHRLLFALVLGALFVAVRLAFLSADPPERLPNGAQIYEIFTDPPAKSYEARTMALFGTWKTSPADNYQFWRVQAPVWVYPLSWFYRAFGVGYPQMRVFSTLAALSGLLAMLLFAGKKLRGFPYLATGLFLTANYYYIIYGRSGLLESLLNTFVILTVYFLYLSRRHLAWLLAAEAALVLSFLTKQTGLYLLPVLLLIGGWSYRTHLRRGVSRWLLAAPLAQGVALAFALGWYVTREDYLRTVRWNYAHMALDHDVADTVELQRFPVLDVLHRLLDVHVWMRGYFMLFPVAGALAALELLRIAWQAALHRRLPEWEAIVALWAVASYGVLLLTPFLHVHYRLILFPPVMLLAGSGLSSLSRQRWVRKRPWVGHAVSRTAVVASLVVHARWYADWARHRSYDLEDAAAAIRAKVGDKEAVFAGMWAAPLLFGTPYRYYYIKSIFNQAPEAIATFGLTHLLVIDRHDLAAQRLSRVFPEPWRYRRSILELDLREHTVVLSKLVRPVTLVNAVPE